MAYSLRIYNINWDVVDTQEYDTDLDSLINPTVLQEALVMQRANQRVTIAHTKTRWEVSWSGKKLYKQKWTWSARVWDKRSPIRRKWWIVFGPRNDRNYHKDMNKKTKRLALISSIAIKLKDDRILALDSYVSDSIKTQHVISIMRSLGLLWYKTLFVIPEWSTHMAKSIRNIDRASYVWSHYLNPYDVINAQKIVFIESTADIVKWLWK